MTRKLWLSAALVVVAGVAFSGPNGTVPKSSPSRYPSHSEHDGVAIGAKLLTSDEARKAFTSDVNRCCVVVEIAVYPRASESFNVAVNDFVLKMKNTETAAKPSSPELVAARLQKKARDERDVTVSQSVGVGYGSGPVYDPVYGQRNKGGVYTSAGVGVGIGGGGDQTGSTDQDRAAMVTELAEKGLPEGMEAAPVAGYLYFALPRDKKAIYQLEYLLNGQKVVLTLN